MDDKLMAVLSALADPTRFSILVRLRSGPAHVGEIALHYPMTFAAISKHLKLLERAGLVSSMRDAQRIIYSLENSRFEIVRDAANEFIRHGEDRLEGVRGKLSPRRTRKKTGTKSARKKER